MRNPLRSEGEAFRFLLVVVGGAIVIAVCAALNTWVGVAAAVLVVGGLVWWLRQPLQAEAAPEPVAPRPVAGTRRVLVLAPADADASDLQGRLRARLADGDAEVLVVVPALATAVEAITGAVDDRRDDAQRGADAVAAQLAAAGIRARGAAGADEPLQAVEDALREFGADEVLLAHGEEGLLSLAQERLAVPVSLLG